MQKDLLQLHFFIFMPLSAHLTEERENHNKAEALEKGEKTFSAQQVYNFIMKFMSWLSFLAGLSSEQESRKQGEVLGKNSPSKQGKGQKFPRTNLLFSFSLRHWSFHVSSINPFDFKPPTELSCKLNHLCCNLKR